jgi:hypothetical protein
MKNHQSSKTFLFIVLSLMLISFNASANNSLSSKDKDILDKAGVPIYPGLKYINGITGDMISMRFATSDNVKTLREWYRKKLPEWAVYDEYGIWILYDGKPGGGPANYMTKKNISITENTNIPQWFSMPANMTTEVTITLP